MFRHSLSSMRKIIVVILSLFVVACVALPEQKTPLEEIIFSPEQMRQDLMFIDQQLRKIHPNPFSRNDLTAYRKGYFDTYNNLSWPRNRHRFYRAILPFVSNFQDTHIQLQLPSEEYQRYSESYGLFPLKVLLVDKQMVVLEDLQELPTVPVGAEIREINTIPVPELVAALQSFISAENESGKTRLIQVHLPELLWSYFPGKTRYTVKFYWRGKLITETLEATPKSLTPVGDKRVKSHYGDISVDANTSVLWLNDFNEDSDRFEDYLDDFFSRLRKEQKTHLILDLRYNEGGVTDNIRQLLTYLTPEPIRWAEEARLKVSKAFKNQNNRLVGDTKDEKYTPYLGWLPLEYLNLWQWEILFASEGDILTTEIDVIESEQENFFTGEIIILSNGYCFSACAAMVASLQKANIATVIGESPGGFVDKQYGYQVQVKLPNTGLLLSIPSVEFILAKDAAHKEVITPHYPVTRRRIDVLSATDIVFQAALEYIKLQKPTVSAF